MSLTPVEVRHQHLRRGLLGYRRKAVDELLEQIAESFEAVWRERADLTDRVEELEADVARHVELEGLLRSTLISAERAAQEQRERARREADTILVEAHAEARTVSREARSQKERLEGEVRRISALLRSALTIVDEGATDAQAEQASHDAVRPGSAPASPDIRRLAG
jgi:cell division initiation protein